MTSHPPESTGSTAGTLSRVKLIEQATRLGVERAEVMTRPELLDAIRRLSTPPPARPSQPPSWFGVARDLLASVVEQGLNLPDAARLIRGESRLSEPPKSQPPVATVTLAKIYAAQGHRKRALAVLRQVIDVEPDHDVARDLLESLERAERRDKEGRGEALATAAPSAENAVHDRETQPEALKASGSVEPEAPSIDAVAIRRLSGGSAELTWELGRPCSRPADSFEELRWVVFTPSWQGPKRRAFQKRIHPGRGRESLQGLSPEAALCASVGTVSEGRFIPRAVCGVRAEPSPEARKRD